MSDQDVCLTEQFCPKTSPWDNCLKTISSKQFWVQKFFDRKNDFNSAERERRHQDRSERRRDRDRKKGSRDRKNQKSERSSGDRKKESQSSHKAKSGTLNSNSGTLGRRNKGGMWEDPNQRLIQVFSHLILKIYKIEFINKILGAIRYDARRGNHGTRIKTESNSWRG